MTTKGRVNNDQVNEPTMVLSLSFDAENIIIYS